MRIEERISSYFENLNATDKEIAQFVLKEKYFLPTMKIEDVAQKCNVSKSTIMRFAQKLNLRGFSELKTIIRIESESTIEYSVNVVENTCKFNIQMIETLEKMDFTMICDRFCKTKRLFVYGTGSIQKAAALEFKRLFLSCGIIVDYIQGESELNKTVRLMNENDSVLIISQDGKSEFIEEICDYLNANKISLISLTFSAHNYLANHSNHRIFIQKYETAVDKNLIFKSNAMLFFAIEIMYTKFITYLSKFN